MSVDSVVEQGIALVSTGVQVAAALLIAVGAAEAVFRALAALIGKPPKSLAEKKLVWVYFARWLMLALEFELAADVLDTLISRDWTSIGQLAAIALIRTFLNYFLSSDAEKMSDPAPAPQ